MKVWFTSDTHFSHRRIIELCDRPFKDVSQMDNQMIMNFNTVIHPDDYLFHLGDVALGPIADSLPLIGRVHGSKYLMVGNHDRIFVKESKKKRERFLPEYEKVFDQIIQDDRKAVLKNGMMVRLNHFPYQGDSHDEDRHADMRPVDDGTVLLHGHTHSKEKLSYSSAGTVMINVGVDAWNYQLVSESTIIDLIESIS